jgi:hypothetical protein
MKKIDPVGLGPMGTGLLIALTHLVFPVCQGLLTLENGKTVPMRCFWTARAEMTLGALLFLTGLVILFTQGSEGRQRLNHLVALLGLAVILTPLVIIPTCANPEMSCNIGTKPAWLISGGLTLLLGLWGSRAPKAELSPSAG